MSVALLMVGPRGTVTHASRAAEDLLGPCVGRACCDLVRARDAADQPVCSAFCAADMTRIGARERDRAQTRIRGRWAQLVCSPMGSQHVVAVRPEAQATPASILLTDREREVLEHVAEGLTTREIARQLEIRPATVRTHVEHAREKLGARTRAEAVARAMELRQLERQA
jgi:DNA-binding CsgD family transcriptional regulator